jgi:hypothetical protein
MRCYIVSVTCAIKISNGNEWFRTDSSNTFGEYVLSDAARHSRALAEKKRV